MTKRRKLITKEEYNNNPNICKNCGEKIYCLENESLSNILCKQFCSQSCAAIFNNKNKKKKGYYCQKCGKLIGYGHDKYGRRQFCDICTPNYVDWNLMTYGEMKGKRKYQVNSRIRELARNIYQKSNKPKKCAVCDYDKHYEVCHIKGISTFTDEALISEINNIENLIALCPNCHWELDNGLLDLFLKKAS